MKHTLHFLFPASCILHPGSSRNGPSLLPVRSQSVTVATALLPSQMPRTEFRFTRQLLSTVLLWSIVTPAKPFPTTSQSSSVPLASVCTSTPHFGQSRTV